MIGPQHAIVHSAQVRRREYKPEAITWEDIALEAQTGKQFLLRDKAGGVTTDRSGRPVLVLRPR